ncbi:MAG: Long-chain-fatty-acid--CoA ligase [Syntrophus sp. SKADARSKE-3]|nr:Long-chain-fatty-acid--CoA ligase [Syntrophus sp. SKADARSKE-3]
MSEKKTYAPGESFKYQLLIKHILEMPRFYAPNQEIVYRDKVRLTYTTLFERINRLSSGLEKLGVGKGDTICVFDYDSHRYLECFFSIPMMGAVLHTQNWRLSPEQILYTMNHAEDKVVLIHTDFLPLLEAVWDKLTTVKKVILITDDGQRPASKITFDAEYEEMLAGASSSYDFPDFDENTRATTFYTTGTTGLPKGVFFSHRQLVLHTQSMMIFGGAYESIARFRSTDVYMPITPMFHVHAWGVPYAATMMGVKQVYPGRYEPEMLLKLILTERVTYSHCVPTIIQMLVGSPVAKKVDLSHWKVIIGGARLMKGLAQAALELGIQIYAGYGMSETCPLLSLAILKPPMLGKSNEEMVDTLIMTGLPAPFVYIRLFDPMGKEVPHDGVSTGEVCVRAPWLTESYYNDAERAKDLWVDGWLHTGDIGYINKEGYLQVTDRIKDVIKTGGEWISSLDLENILSQHEAVLEGAAIGIPDAKWGERPFMVAVLKPDFKSKTTGEDLRQFLLKNAEAGKIPKYGVPDRVEIVDAIPKTSVGKINKIELRKAYN